MAIRTIIVLSISLIVLAAPTLGQEEKDLWNVLRLLEGHWSGEGSGFGSVSDVIHDWQFVLQGQFLRLQTKSITKGQKGTEEIHEDFGFLSYDKDRSSFVFRQFLSDGFVNTFDVNTENSARRRIEFAFRESESAGGMRARMFIQFQSETEYEMVLELATKEKEFTPCQKMYMKKVK